MDISLQQKEAQQLFNAFQIGDREAFNSFFIKYYPIFCSFANHYLEYDEAEEIAQNVMVWLWENKDSIVIESSALSYCFKVIKNQCLKQIGKKELKGRIISLLYKNEHTIYDDPDFYIAEELYRKIESAISSLPSSYREAFEMNRFKNMTYQTIAEKLNISSKTVDYRIQCALKQLKIDLKDYLPLLTGIIF